MHWRAAAHAQFQEDDDDGAKETPLTGAAAIGRGRRRCCGRRGSVRSPPRDLKCGVHPEAAAAAATPPQYNVGQ